MKKNVCAGLLCVSLLLSLLCSCMGTLYTQPAEDDPSASGTSGASGASGASDMPDFSFDPPTGTDDFPDDSFNFHEDDVVVIYSWEDYLDYLSSSELPENFIEYKDLQKIGDFRGFKYRVEYDEEDPYDYAYKFTDVTGREIVLYVYHDPHILSLLEDAQPITELDESTRDMRTYSRHSSYTYSGIRYRYMYYLDSIFWEENGVYFMLAVFPYFGDYPENDSTFVGRLLNLETAEI